MPEITCSFRQNSSYALSCIEAKLILLPANRSCPTTFASLSALFICNLFTQASSLQSVNEIRGPLSQKLPPISEPGGSGVEREGSQSCCGSACCVCCFTFFPCAHHQAFPSPCHLASCISTPLQLQLPPQREAFPEVFLMGTSSFSQLQLSTLTSIQAQALISTCLLNISLCLSCPHLLASFPPVFSTHCS